MLAMLLCALMAVPADVLTVDDSGGAHFTTIQAAIDTASAGDVIEIEPGNYTAFTLRKDLVLIGPSDGTHPQIGGISQVLKPPGFVLAGLDFTALRLSAVPGRGVLDECNIGVSADAGQIGLEIHECGQLIVSRCQVRGPVLPSTSGFGVVVTDSRVSFVSCSLGGGPGMNTASEPGGDGGLGVQALEASELWLVHTTVFGGGGGIGGGIFGSRLDGNGGDGMYALDSTTELRGTVEDGLFGGYSEPPAIPGLGLQVVGGIIVVSGASLDSVALGGAVSFVQAAVPEPFLRADGIAAPGGHVQFALHGPAGAAGLLLIGLEPASIPLAKLELPLWVAPGNLTLVPVVTAGNSTPIVLNGALPQAPELVALTITAQAVFPGVSSGLAPTKACVTNPAAIVVRF